MKIARVAFLLPLSFMLLVGCSGMSYDPYDQSKWLAKIYSNPPGAEIYVDGIHIGTAPLEYNYPSIGLTDKEVVARFPSGCEQSLTTGYYIFEILFDFTDHKATIKEYPEAFSIVAQTREVQYESNPPLPPEMLQNALSEKELREVFNSDEHLPDTPPIPPEISTGPLLEILTEATGKEKVKVLADAEGMARVLITSKELRQALEIIVSPDAVVKRRVIQSGVTPESIDGAFDAQGRLHVLLDNEHYVLAGETWQKSSQTPWQGTKLKVWGVRFVPGAPDLIWAFQADGAEFDAPTRMDIYGFGGYGAGIIWPWFTHGNRTVLVSEVAEEYGPWLVLDPQRKESTFATSLAADRHKNIYIIYERSRSGLASATSYFYVRVDGNVLNNSENSLPGVKEIQLKTRRIRALPEGSARSLDSGGEEKILPAVSVDLENETALVGMRSLVRGKTWSKPKYWPPSDKSFRVVLAPAGQESFNALNIGKPRDPWRGKGFPVQYLVFSEGAWSLPIEIGVADMASFWGSEWNAVGIASVEGGAFLVWPMKQGIVGRWVHRFE